MNPIGYGKKKGSKSMKGGAGIFNRLGDFLRRTKLVSRGLKATSGVLAATKYAALSPLAERLGEFAAQKGYSKKKKKSKPMYGRGGDNVNRMNILIKSLKHKGS